MFGMMRLFTKPDFDSSMDLASFTVDGILTLTIGYTKMTVVLVRMQKQKEYSVCINALC